MADDREIAVLGGGCFWCTEAVFLEVEGVLAVKSGYAGGHVDNPTYEQVCRKDTGHIEVISVTFDPSVISYADVLRIFFATHDPTTLDRQGNDVGPQYRSAVFVQSPEQEATARAVIAQFEAENTFGAPIVTEIRPAATVWPAEAYHDDYFRRNPRQPYCAYVIGPKVAKLRQYFQGRLKKAV